MSLLWLFCLSVFISSSLSVSSECARMQRSATGIEEDPSENEDDTVTAGADSPANRTLECDATRAHTGTVFSSDTAAISYHLSHLTAEEKETDGRRNGKE